MPSGDEIIQTALRVLNEALAADPLAINELIQHRVVVTSADLIGHPTIQSGEIEGKVRTSALGLINGILGEHGYIGLWRGGRADGDILSFVRCFPTAGTTRTRRGLRLLNRSSVSCLGARTRTFLTVLSAMAHFAGSTWRVTSLRSRRKGDPGKRLMNEFPGGVMAEIRTAAFWDRIHDVIVHAAIAGALVDHGDRQFPTA